MVYQSDDGRIYTKDELNAYLKIQRRGYDVKVEGLKKKMCLKMFDDGKRRVCCKEAIQTKKYKKNRCVNCEVIDKVFS